MILLKPVEVEAGKRASSHSARQSEYKGVYLWGLDWQEQQDISADRIGHNRIYYRSIDYNNT